MDKVRGLQELHKHLLAFLPTPPLCSGPDGLHHRSFEPGLAESSRGFVAFPVVSPVQLQSTALKFPYFDRINEGMILHNPICGCSRQARRCHSRLVGELIPAAEQIGIVRTTEEFGNLTLDSM